MSHVASLASVVFLTAGIVLSIISLSTPWWTDDGSQASLAVRMEASLFSATFKYEGVRQGLSPDKIATWDEICDRPTLDSDILKMCPVIGAARNLLIVGAVFAFLAAAGNTAGIYTGNTLIDSAAGVVAAFSAMFSGVSLATAFMIRGEGLTGSPGFMTVCLAVGLQFTGGLCGCIGTCQEMRDMAKLAASLHLGVYKETEKGLARSEKCAKIREVEQGEAQEIYCNLQKRKKAAEEAALNSSGELDLEDDTKDKKKVPVMLQRVLFRKPVDGDEDEIPTRMLEDAFAEIDGDGSGSIELDELVDALSLCGLKVSKTATDTIIQEIDKNASGDVDLREFIEFFRHIEDLNRFSKKSAARQQFVSFLLNFCFLADIVVVGVMLMMFIRMDATENPDNYSIMKNVLMACSFVLGILFLLVILMPILRLALGPTANRMQKQYELAQEIKKSQKKPPAEAAEDTGPRQVAYGPDDAPPPVNAAMFGRSYRPGKVDSAAWTPALEDLPPPSRGGEGTLATRTGSHTGSQSGPSQSGSGGVTSDGRMASHNSDRAASHNSHGPRSAGGGSDGGHGSGHHEHTTVTVVSRGRDWRYDPSNYSNIYTKHANIMEERGTGPMSWTPMQVRDVTMPKQTNPGGVLPGIPQPLTDASFPQPAGIQRIG